MPRDRPLHPLRAGRVVRGREDQQLVDLADHVAGQRVQVVELLHLVAEELDPDRQLLVRRDDLQRVAADPERAAVEGQVVARVLDVDQPPQQLVALDLLPDLHPHRPVEVLLRRAQAVDRRDGRHHDHVAAGQQRHRRRVPQPLDLLVDRGVLLDVGVGLRDVRLGLVVVVVARRSTRPRCCGSSSRNSLASCAASVLLGASTRVGRCSRSTSQAVVALLPVPVAPSSTDVPVAAPDPALQLVDGGRLVAGRLEVADDLETAVQPGDVERHGTNRTPAVRHTFCEQPTQRCATRFDIRIVRPPPPGYRGRRRPLAAAARAGVRPPHRPASPAHRSQPRLTLSGAPSLVARSDRPPRAPPAPGTGCRRAVATPRRPPGARRRRCSQGRQPVRAAHSCASRRSCANHGPLPSR